MDYDKVSIKNYINTYSKNFYENFFNNFIGNCNFYIKMKYFEQIFYKFLNNEIVIF